MRRLALFALATLILIPIAGPRAYALLGQQRGGSLSGSGHATHQPVALTNGLVAWYPFEGDAKDYSSNANNGTLNNFNGNTTDGYTAGKYGKGMLFDGTDDYVSAPDAVSLDPSNVTLSAWVNMTSTTAQGFISKRTSFGVADEFNLLYVFGSGFQMRIGGDTTVGHYAVYNPTVGSGWNFGAWHHLAGTYNGTTIQLYFDGLPVGTTGTPSGGIISANSPLSIGALNSGTSPMPGSIDDARIYNRALSSAEIATLYAGTQPYSCDQTCIGWWKLDESGSTTTAVDSIGGNNGTLNSFTFDGSTNGWNSGVFGDAVTFNGSNTNISIGTPSALNFGTNSFTVANWYKYTASTGASWYTITNRNSFSAAGYDITINNNGVAGTTTFRISDGTTVKLSTDATGQNDGNWHFGVGVVDRTGSVYNWYVDGKLISSLSLSGLGSLTSATSLTLGSRANSTAYYNGSLDDVRLWNRALTGYEVADMYLAGR